MHVYFSGINGTGLCPLALIALEQGFKVSGSDPSLKNNHSCLFKKKITLFSQQSYENIQLFHQQHPIDWLVYTSAINEATHPEIQFAKRNNIKLTKRNHFINFIINQNNLKLISVVGTHGKTTTTAMLIWLLFKLKIPFTHLVGSRLNFLDSGGFIKNSNFFIMETDEYDKNFLSFKPYATILTSLDYDHPDTYPSKKSYFQAFEKFLTSSSKIYAYKKDLNLINDLLKKNLFEPSLTSKIQTKILDFSQDYRQFRLLGKHNRRNAKLVETLFHHIFNENQAFSPDEITKIISDFPGTERRMEKLAEKVFSDYAHHPTEIKATLQLVKEAYSKVAVVYQPHQNQRQLEIFDLYKDSFLEADKIYWLETFQVREKAGDRIIKAKEFIESLKNKEKAVAADMDLNLIHNLKRDLKSSYAILFLGAGDIDLWARKNLKAIIENI